MDYETSIGGSNVRFATTAWSVVCQAGEGCRAALDELVRAYWKPVYFFIRRRGESIEGAKDLTQAFFARLIEKREIGAATPDRSRFRTFLLTGVSWFLANERDRARAACRGGEFDFEHAERLLAVAAPDDAPSQAFEREWARELMERALAKLEPRIGHDGMSLLRGESPAHLTPQERKQRARTVRAKLRECLREEILPSVQSDRQVDSEIRVLFSALSHRA